MPDRGPYWIANAEHANAEIDAARKALRLVLTPALIVIAGECGIGVCLLLLWLAERDRRELLYFAVYLISTGLSLSLGIWVVFTGASSFWYRLGFRPLNDQAFLFLCLAASLFLRLRKLRWPILAGAAAVSAALTLRTIFYLYSWLILLAWQWRRCRVRMQLRFSRAQLAFFGRLGLDLSLLKSRVKAIISSAQ